jgi:hypothetical protein
MLRIVIASIAALTAAAAQADDLQVNVELQNVERQGAFVNTMFKLENASAVDYRVVFVECVLLDKDKRALDSALNSVTRVSAGSINYGKVTIMRKLNDIKFAQCRAVNAARS